MQPDAGRSAVDSHSPEATLVARVLKFDFKTSPRTNSSGAIFNQAVTPNERGKLSKSCKWIGHVPKQKRQCSVLLKSANHSGKTLPDYKHGSAHETRDCQSDQSTRGVEALDGEIIEGEHTQKRCHNNLEFS